MIGDNIRKALENKGITSNELAKRIGVSVPYISYLLNNKRTASVEILEKIANVLDVKISEFFEDEFQEVSLLFERVTKDINKLQLIYKTDPTENLKFMIKNMDLILSSVKSLIKSYNILKSKVLPDEDTKQIMIENKVAFEELTISYEKIRVTFLDFIDTWDDLDMIDNYIDDATKAIIEALKNASPAKKAKVLKMIELFEDEK